MADAAHMPNFRSAAAQMAQAESLYRGLFEHSPLPLLVLTPECRIANANDAYLSATGRRRDTLAGLDMFVAFPDSPHDPSADGVRNLSASFERALRNGAPDLMPLQRYDIQPEGQPWEVRYWHPANWAVLDEAGSVLALIHHVTDVTTSLLAGKSRVRPVSSTAEVLAWADAIIREGREVRKTVRQDLLRAREQTQWLLSQGRGPK
ncbi:PAS domain-containing protein [Methylobacterium sp. P31]